MRTRHPLRYTYARVRQAIGIYSRPMRSSVQDANGLSCTSPRTSFHFLPSFQRVEKEWWKNEED